MKKIFKSSLAVFCAAAMLIGCGKQNAVQQAPASSEQEVVQPTEKKVFEGATAIELSDDGITVDGEAISTDTESAVYAANDIVFYLEGQGFTYGEGEKEDEHSQAEADTHTVVHITQPGTYALSGKISAGQVAVDLGKDAEEDPEAVVTLILNGVDITCTVAPGVIFYNVYECGSDDADSAVKDVDTTAAGANVIIADGTINNVTGSYVARIYKSYELNAAGTEVVSNKKLHKYDAAFYSKKTMNVNGDTLGTGILNIVAENEGLDSELHLTINGGNINIYSGNDGINTNEDGVSVTTVNGGVLNIIVSGTTGEGDGIDSNGWLVINGGIVASQACGFSMDSGIDSDMGIYINGGVVVATGNMLDSIAGSEQNYAVFSFASSQQGGNTYTLKTEKGGEVFSIAPANSFTYLIVSAKDLAAGTYTFWNGSTQLAASTGSAMGGMMGMPGGFGGMQMPGGFSGMQMPEGFGGIQMPEDFSNIQLPEGVQIPEGTQMPNMQLPEGVTLPEGMQLPEGFQMPQNGKMPSQGNGKRPEGQEPTGGMPGGFQGGMQGNFNGGDKKGERPNGGFGGQGGFNMGGNAELSTEFVIVEGANYFSYVSPAK